MATEHSQDQTSIGNEDGLASLNRRCKGGVGTGELFVAALEVVVGSEGDALALFELDFLGAVGEET